MVDRRGQDGLSEEELGAEGVTALPDKEVVSILDLNADINLAIDAAAPIDLAAAANANVAAPIDAAVGANVLSVDSTSQALSDQGALIHQGLDANATAHADQGSAIGQGGDAATATTPADGAHAADPAAAASAGATTPATDPASGAVSGAATDPVSGAVDGAGGAVNDVTSNTGAGALNGDLLNVDVKVDANADVAAPINGAVAANANVAAPIDAAVGANVGSVHSDAVAVSQQDAIINQDLHGSADATSNQSSDIKQ